ncbi:MAG: sterol desaturase family protein [Halobacteriovoraceae bacterium]|nr:sterol desaturase family protein [Halobacteriovoraceae bacterium]
MKAKEHQSIRIFRNPLLERCTHVHPLTPLILWTPFIFFLLWQGLARNLIIIEWIAVFLTGLLFWSLTEYLMHRFVFHFPAKSKAANYLVHLFHGLHHDDPNDPSRLVMPPVPAILMISTVYLLLYLWVPDRYFPVFMAAFLVGYLIYDYIHYATHHFSMKSKVGRFLKKHHFHHHFSNHSVKFGVSNPLWDYVFDTYKK